MSSTPSLMIVGTDMVTMSAAPLAFERRDELALCAAEVNAVSNPIQAEHASAILKQLKAFTAAIEECRKEVKAPVLDLSRQIDGLADMLTSFLVTESARIALLLGTYTAEQRRIAEKAQREAQEKEREIRAEANAKIQAAVETSRTDAEAVRKIEKIDARTFEAIAAARTSAPAMQMPAGIATRTTIKFEVTDVHALYAARPDFVKLEAHKNVINAVLKANPRASIPGLRTWEESSAVTR